MTTIPEPGPTSHRLIALGATVTGSAARPAHTEDERR